MIQSQLSPSSALSSLEALKNQIKVWGKQLGFTDIGVSDIELSPYEAGYFNWIGECFHGEMEYMVRHGTKRTRPNELEPGTLSIISVRMNYLDGNAQSPVETLHQSDLAYISRYALGKDYHKLMRKRLQKLAQKIHEVTEHFHYRAFVDSAPVLERPIAQKAGLGFIGKNSLVIHPRAGSWFFLGEIYCNLALPKDPPFEKQGCGPCTACIDECPTQAIVANGVVDSRRCISYLTIEYKGSIPLEFRSLMGNRIYGCDDCQLVCPWNKFTDNTQEPGFKTRHHLDAIGLLDLWQWSETDFLTQFAGSPIRRIGYAQWKRNLAVSIGNIQADADQLKSAIHALEQALPEHNALVQEHILWAIQQLKDRLQHPSPLRKTTQDATSEIRPFVAKKYYLPKAAKP